MRTMSIINDNKKFLTCE